MCKIAEQNLEKQQEEARKPLPLMEIDELIFESIINLEKR